MNNEPRKWLNQYYANIGGKEFLRFGCAIGIWILLRIVLREVFHSTWILFVFVAVLMIFSLLSLLWKPMYLIHRKILGNPNLPTEPIPRQSIRTPRPTGQPIPWFYSVPAILMAMWKILVSLLVSYFIIKYLLR